MTLPEFLLARIAEDEALLADGGRVFGGEGEVWTPTAEARVLAECEAKRTIIEMVTGAAAMSEVYTPFLLALRALAGAYSSHPDYREEWRA